jgi:hypothetical protein
MTDEERGEEGTEEEIEDLEAPAVAQGGVIGGLPCRPTNRCAPVNTMVNCPNTVTQLCLAPTCAQTQVLEQ